MASNEFLTIGPSPWIERGRVVKKDLDFFLDLALQAIKNRKTILIPSGAVGVSGVENDFFNCPIKIATDNNKPRRYSCPQECGRCMACETTLENAGKWVKRNASRYGLSVIAGDTEIIEDFDRDGRVEDRVLRMHLRGGFGLLVGQDYDFKGDGIISVFEWGQRK